MSLIDNTTGISDATLAARIRRDVDYLNADLRDAKRRGIDVGIEVMSGSFGVGCLGPHDVLTVKQIAKTRTENL